MLTAKQQQLLLLIHHRLDQDGVAPSYDEMKDALNLRSKSGIHRLISALEERGFIRRLPNRARAVEILRMPEALLRQIRGERPAPAKSSGGSILAFRPSGQPRTKETGEALSVPVMGKIAAGVPISAIQDHSHDIPLPPGMMGPGEHFALTVSGDSMIEAGIQDGDIVIIRRTESADLGDIVVALVDDEEATLKRFRRQGRSIALEAANPAYETRVLSPNRVKVQGRLVGLLRSY